MGRGDRLKDSKIYFLILILMLLVLTQSGCSLLQIPGTIVKGSFSLLGKLIGVANKIPKPPPWVFL